MVCAWHVPGQAASWDSAATASPQFHLPPSHLQSNLMSSSNTLGVAWQRQYQHRNSCTGMETAVLAWQRGGREIKMSGRSPLSASQSNKAAPSPSDTSEGFWAPDMTNPASLISPPPCPALYEMSCWVSAQVSQSWHMGSHSSRQMSFVGPYGGRTMPPLTTPRESTWFEGHKSVRPEKIVPGFLVAKGISPAASASVCRNWPVFQGYPCGGAKRHMGH